MKKYILMGGNIRSKNDGQIHFISANKLCELYGLNQDECFFCDERFPATYRGIRSEDLTILYPNYEGDYSVKD